MSQLDAIQLFVVNQLSNKNVCSKLIDSAIELSTDLYRAGNSDWRCVELSIQTALVSSGYGRNAQRLTNYLNKLRMHNPDRFQGLWLDSPNTDLKLVHTLHQA